MSTSARFCAALVLALAGLGFSAEGQTGAPTPTLTFDDIMSLKVLAAPAIAPDGTSVLYAIQQWSEPPAKPARRDLQTRVWRVAVDSTPGQPAVRLMSPPDRDASSPAWSPDGRSICYLSAGGRTGGRPQIWIAAADGASVSQITDVADGAGNPAWSPDSTRIAFTAREPAGPDDEERRARGDDLTVFEEDFRRVQLWVVDVRTKQVSRVATGGEVTVKGAPTWSADGTRLAFIASPTPLTRDHRDAAYVADLPTRTLEKITTNPARLRTPAWSPDGRMIAFASQAAAGPPLGDGILPEPIGLYHLVLFDVPTRTAHDVFSASFDRNMGSPVWTPDSRRILFSTEDGVFSNVFAYDIGSGRYSRLTTHRNIGFGSISRDGSRLAFTMESPNAPAELFVSDPTFGSPRQLTSANPHLAGRALGTTDVISWKGTDGATIEGLLLKPVGYENGRRYPLLVVVHGGPASAHLADFNGSWATGGGASGQYWAGQGWAVLYPNPRGSRSYGEAFVRAVVGDWGGVDHRDIMAGVEALIARGIADKDRLAIKGWSYGGYQTCWTVSQTGRFKAAVMGAGIADVVSFHGTTGIPGRTAAYFNGIPSDATAALYRGRSGLTYAGRVTTPLLIMHGAADTTVPAGQSYEFYRALRERGKTVQLVIYPREGHVLNEYAHLVDMFRREYEWIVKYTLAPQEAR